MYYVAYGSNMNLRQMVFRCPNSRVICNGKLKGWKLVFNVHADVIKTGDDNDIVPVVVWEIDERDWEALDRYEGCPYYYIRETTNVILNNGRTEKGIVYVMTGNRKGICPPTRDYFECIEDACFDNGIDVGYLYDALKYALDNKTEYNQYRAREMI